MSLLRHFILPITLGLVIAPTAWAGDDDKKTSDKKMEEQTIRGIVSEVTLVGETDVDITTGKAVTADQVFLTIVGHHAWNNDEKEKAREHASNDKDKDVRRSSTDAPNSSERRHHRMNVYVIAVNDKTKVCECKEAGKEGSASAAKEEKCDLDKLEIGDRVEITFASKMADKEDSKDKAETQKHGRHRVYFGMATDIKILDENWAFEHSQPKDSKDSKDSKDKK
jgi:hypothetical protein